MTIYNIEEEEKGIRRSQASQGGKSSSYNELLHDFSDGQGFGCNHSLTKKKTAPHLKTILYNR